jgi:hypothetical protein
MNSDPVKRRNRALILVGLNLACLPGLGTVLSRRWISGALQMLVFVTGFFLATPAMLRYLVEAARGIATSEIPSMEWRPIFAAALLCVASWLWSLQSSARIVREMKSPPPS